MHAVLKFGRQEIEDGGVGVVSDFADVASRFVNHDEPSFERLQYFSLALDVGELIDLTKVIGFYAAVDLHHTVGQYLACLAASELELVVKELFELHGLIGSLSNNSPALMRECVRSQAVYSLDAASGSRIPSKFINDENVLRAGSVFRRDGTIR